MATVEQKSRSRTGSCCCITQEMDAKVPGGGFSRGFREAQPNEKKKKSGWTSGFTGLFRRNKQVAAKKSTSSDDSADEPGKVIGSHSQHQLPAGTLLHPPRPPSKDRYSPVVRDGFLSSPLQSEHSSSTTSLSRKERREAILARAQARRNDESAAGGSSSDEQQDSLPRGSSPSLSQQRHHRRHHYSQESLTSNGKSRSSRTERYIQRRSRDEECLVTPKYWPPTISPQNSNGSSSQWGSEILQRQPEPMSPTNTRLTVGQSPVMLRKPPGSSYNNLGIPTGRAQSALITHGKLSVHPPPPPPRNPLKKSYLLQVNDPGSMHPQNNNNFSGRPTSYSFGEVRHNQPYPTRSSQPLHDYQNVDQNGRILVDKNSPGHRRVLLNGSVTTTPVIYSQQSPKPSGLYPVTAKSPSPFRHNDDNERPVKPPWISKPIGSSPAPVRDFWRSKDTIQQQLPKQSARERLAISSPLNEKSTPGGMDQHHNRSFVKSTAGNVNGPPTPVTPKRIQNGAGIMSSNSSPNLHPVRELSQLRPSNDRHLEQAICELEAIYRSLRLEGDEDLLDRAERRDLPTVHQQLAAVNGNHHNLVCSGSESGGDPLHGPGITSDLDTMMNWSVSGSFESLARPSTPSRVRAPPRRRSALPDKLMDDMAVRRLAASRQQSLPPKDYESGSYLLVTPSIAAAEEKQNNNNIKRRSSSDSSSRCGSSEPDIVLDDVAVRAVRAANLPLKKVLDPQPPFGIPNKLCLGPVPPTSPSDYLHAQVTPCLIYIFFLILGTNGFKS